MKLNLCRGVVYATLVIYSIFIDPAGAAVFQVTSTHPSNSTSLKRAIDDANASAGTDTITFAIPGTGPFTIQPREPLPVITDTLIIDGYTQAGSSPASGSSPATIMIELDGSMALSANGLHVSGVAAVIRGLCINRFSLDGICLENSDGSLIEGNHVGTDVTGSTGLANSGHGVGMYNSSGTTVGGITAAARNLIAENGANGISVDSGTGNRFLSNHIWSNAGVGIDLASDGVTPNDTGDSDTGANDLQNYPVLSGALTDENAFARVEGSLNSLTSTTFRLQFFHSDTCDPSGFGEGQYLFGDTLVTTDGSGDVSFSFDFDASVPESAFITATATDTTLGTTSEFSQATIAVRPFVVTNTNDSGTGSLRWTIINANAFAGTDTITFAIPGTGPFTIQPNSELPTIFDPVIIDGYSQSGSSPASERGPATLMIELDGTNAESDAYGLALFCGGSSITGLCINRFYYGIGLLSDGGNTIEGNHIGTDISGTIAHGNSSYGVRISYSFDNIIGGTSTAARNIISGNDQSGINIVGSTATGNLIQGNYIGTDAHGNTDLGNSHNGVYINIAPDNTIGGITAGAGNIISGNDLRGIFVNGSSSSGTLIQGNYIGTNNTGDADLGNGYDGVYSSYAPNTTIGGTSQGAGNIISGNDANGLSFSGDDNLIQGNLIGTDATGATDLGNSEDGVNLFNAHNNTIGGISENAKNIIAYNTGNGIYIYSNSNSNHHLSNSIFFNDGLGIDLYPNGVNANDTGDPDTGANDLQNYPVLSLAGTNGFVQGSLNSLASTTFRLQFFHSDTCDGTGYGEGQYLLGDTLVTTDGSGDVSFSFDFDTALPEGAFITATATDTTLGNTSEFCQVLMACILDSFTVVNNNDKGFGSLRWAMENANASAGTDTITFDIPGTGPFTIQPDSSLPIITDPVVIDGYSQSGSSPASERGPATLMIELDGTNAGTTDGLTISSGSSVVRGLCINRFEENAILLDTAGGNNIQGNYLGTDVLGSSGQGNEQSGIYVWVTGDNTIGGMSPSARNVISDNQSSGITVLVSSSNVIQGNFIGTDASGQSPLGNIGPGIVLPNGYNNIVGGPEPTARNIIADNSWHGISLFGSGCTANVVQGNYVGTDVSGTLDLGNTLNGIYLHDCPGNTIGGSSAGEGNLVSGNDGSGILLDQDECVHNVIRGNYIGTDATGTSALGNSSHGIAVQASSSLGNTIGGEIAWSGNTISFNGGDGIYVSSSSSGCIILSNLLSLNTGLGIDLYPNGVTMNDADDIDTGANDLQNYPVLTNALTNETSFAQVTGSLNSLASTTFRLQFFHNDTCDGTGYGEGQYLLGDTLVTTDGSGDVSFSIDFAAAVPESAYITATATDTTLGNTSEFCKALMVEALDLVLTGVLSGSDLVLEWNTVPPATNYWVYGAINEPYFLPQTESPFEYRVHVLSDTTWTSSAGIADPDTNWTYQVIAVDDSGNALIPSNRVGEYEFMLP